MTRVIVTGVLTWLAVVICILVAWHQFRRYGKAVDAAQEAAWEEHVGSALDLLDEGDNEQQIAADCARLVDETTTVLWLEAQR